MLKSLKTVTAALALGLCSLPASADTFTFSHEFSGSGSTCANTSCATLTVVQDGNDVDFVLTATLASGEFITGLFGNQNPFDLTTGDFTNFGGTGLNAFTGVQVGLDSFKADGDGNFDFLLSFSTSPPRLDGSDTFTFTIEDTTVAEIVNATSQGGSAGKTGFTFALRVQGLGPNNQGSGFFDSTGGGGGQQEASEPSMLALLGLGLLMLGFLRRKAIA